VRKVNSVYVLQEVALVSGVVRDDVGGYMGGGILEFFGFRGAGHGIR